MSNDKQKSQEQDHFDLFKDLFNRRYSKWRDGKESHRDGQKPYFLIVYPDKILGIEHTGVFIPKGRCQAVSPQQREGWLWKIVNDARIICENDHILPSEVKVWFSTELEDAEIKIKEVNQLSKQLAEFVEKEFRKGLTSPMDFNDPLPGISQILIEPGILDGDTWLTCHRWTKCAVGERQTEFVAELQERIDEKNKEYREYIDNCDECWLLIVADRKNPAQNFDIDFSSKVADYTYQSKFTKTFYLEITHKRLLELRTMRYHHIGIPTRTPREGE